MGTFHIGSKVENVADRSKSATLSKLLVDTGSEYTWITESILEKRGIATEALAATENSHWVLRLRHPVWGEAKLVAARDLPMPPGILIDMDARLLAEERGAFRQAGCGVAQPRPWPGRRNCARR